MGLKFPDKLSSNNLNEYGLTDANQISGHKTITNLEELFKISESILSISGNNTNNDAIGQLWFIESLNDHYKLIDWSKRKELAGWEKFSVPIKTIFSETAPDDQTAIWVTEDKGNLPKASSGTDVLLNNIQKILDEFNKRLTRVEYGFDVVLDPGDLSNFAGSELKNAEGDGIDPGLDLGEQLALFANRLNTLENEEDSNPGIEPVEFKNAQPNIKHSLTKTCRSTSQMKNYEIMHGEQIYFIDTNCLYIGVDGKWKLLNGNNSGGGDGGGGTNPDPDPNPDPNKPMDKLDLIIEGTDRLLRIKATTNGLRVYDAAIDDAEDQKIVTENEECLKGLMLSMVYAGPEDADANSYNVSSHSFVELYNSTDQAINLKGCSLQYGTTLQKWNIIELTGIVPAKHCFLIRFNQVSQLGINTTRIVVDRYDMDFPNIKLTNKGIKLYLRVGKTDCNVLNPWNSTSFNNGYIDLVGLKNRDTSISFDINGFEGTTANVLSDVCAGYRHWLGDYNQTNSAKKVAYGDTNSNSKDWASLDLSRDMNIKNSNIIYKPYCTTDGPKDMFYNREKFNHEKPNMPTFTIGNLFNTRCFNWVSVGYYDEFLQYRIKGQSTWISVESHKTGDYQRKRLKAVDGVFFTVHKVIIKGLTENSEYEWRCGRENHWSDVGTFSVLNPTGTFKFVQVTDQQGWTSGEYNPWNIAIKKIIEQENKNNSNKFPVDNTGIHFIMNTGDMTNNGNRPGEWLNYYNSAYTEFHNVAQMNTVGNNDLCPFGSQAKVNPDSFEWFYTYEYEAENKQQISSEFMKSVYAFDYGCVHFVCINSNNYIEEQKAWFTAHMALVKARPTQPKWFIAFTHDAMFNITTDYKENVLAGSGKRDSKLNQASDEDINKRFKWSRLLEENGFRLCLSGHKHTYSRTFALKETVVDHTTNPTGQPVNYLRPTYDPNNPQTGDGVTYVMCQATGYKLQSNKDVPAQGIEWLAKYFPGSNGASSTDQKAPTFITWEISPTQVLMKSYQVSSLTNGSTWDEYMGMQPGITDPENISLIKIDELTLLYK